MTDSTQSLASETDSIVVGQEYRTPWEPSGIVRVTEIGDHYGQKMARVVHVDDHPSGYPAGSVGAYFCNELKPI